MRLHPRKLNSRYYEHVYKELQRDGVTLDLLWREYVDGCRQPGELPYQSTQLNKYYNDFCAKKNATLHLNHKPGEIMQVDWAGNTTGIIDTDTGELIKVYVFVATLPYRAPKSENQMNTKTSAWCGVIVYPPSMQKILYY